jgi:hypothetical protein
MSLFIQYNNKGSIKKKYGPSPNPDLWINTTSSLSQCHAPVSLTSLRAQFHRSIVLL